MIIMKLANIFIISCIFLSLNNTSFAVDLEAKQSVMIARHAIQQKYRDVRLVMRGGKLVEDKVPSFFSELILYSEDLSRFINGLPETNESLNILSSEELSIIMNYIDREPFNSHRDYKTVVQRVKGILGEEN